MMHFPKHKHKFPATEEEFLSRKRDEKYHIGGLVLFPICLNLAVQLKLNVFYILPIISLGVAILFITIYFLTNDIFKEILLIVIPPIFFYTSALTLIYIRVPDALSWKYSDIVQLVVIVLLGFALYKRLVALKDYIIARNDIVDDYYKEQSAKKNGL